MTSTMSFAHKQHYSWQQTMLRIKDPKATLQFYKDICGMSLVHSYKFDDMKFSLYFLKSTRPNEVLPKPNTPESEQYLWSTKDVCLELTHNHGAENDTALQYNNGNVEPNRGFGHIAFFVDDVYETCADMEKKGVKFQKKPDEGRMKGLAFALDPDGYWLEIIKRGEESKFKGFSLSQTMIRIKDPKKSLKFYTEHCGMTLIAEKHFSSAKFSLYFLATFLDEEQRLAVEQMDKSSTEAWAVMKNMFNPVLELTHNHGTEDDQEFSYHNGNTEPKGFGHIGFLVDNLEEACAELEQQGVSFKKKPSEGSMKNIAFAFDPDGYWVELIQRNASFQT